MAKLTIDQLKKLATLVGVQAVEIVDKEADADYNEDELLSQIDAARLEVLRPQIVEEVNKTANDAATARLSGTISSLISQLTGMKRSELAELKTDKERLEKGLEYYRSKMDQGAEELRKEMENMTAAHNQALEAEKAQRKQVEEEWRSKYTEREINEALVQEFSKLPLPKDTDRYAAARLYSSFLKSQYHLHWDEEGKKLSLRDMKNHELPVYNDGKNKVINVMDKAEEFFKPLGIWQTSTKNVNPAQQMNNVNNNGEGNTARNDQKGFKSIASQRSQEMLNYIESKTQE